jgi:hypothetical protein
MPLSFRPSRSLEVKWDFARNSSRSRLVFARPPRACEDIQEDICQLPIVDPSSSTCSVYKRNPKQDLSQM